jgi:hypothetical protein
MCVLCQENLLKTITQIKAKTVKKIVTGEKELLLFFTFVVVGRTRFLDGRPVDTET